MASGVRFVPDSAGYVDLMQSESMVGVLHGYSDFILSAASAAISPDKHQPLSSAPYAEYDFKTSERAGVRIQTHNAHADYAERKHGHLQAAAGV